MSAEVSWVPPLLAVLGISAISLIGAVSLVLSRGWVERILFGIVAFAAGALLGDAFFHLVPEIAESASGFDTTASVAILAGVLTLFTLEKVLHWHHAHFPSEEVLHPVAVTNLVGDGLHNFVDGAIVAGSFAVSTELGIATAIAVALHEIPQEFGDFGILLHAGLSPARALALNFASAALAILGAVAVLALVSVETIERILVPFSAGAFIYIASTDLLPDLHKEPETGKSLAQLVALVGGIAAMAALLLLE
jgi:zinc and cadmium transporter